MSSLLEDLVRLAGAVIVVAAGFFLAMPDKPLLVKVGWILVVYGASLTSAALMRGR